MNEKSAYAMPGQAQRDRLLTREEVASVCDDFVGAANLAGKRLLLLVPDHTRSCPLDLMFELLYERLSDTAECFHVLMALGTHPPMDMEAIYRRMGITAEEHGSRYSRARFFNHAWNDPSQLAQIGILRAAEIHQLTAGRFAMDVAVTCNRLALNYDALLIVGPVFPHEVVGFSGGNKYIFPGISGPQVLNFFHWLGAVITSPCIIGKKWTPVREVIDRAAAMLPVERHALCMVVKDDGLAGLYGGTPEQAWSAAADLSERIHIQYKDQPFQTVVSCAPPLYDDLWVGAKCMYKLEPVVADGGRLIIYAPHIREVSRAHGATLHEIGYHTRDYFLKQWDCFKAHPWGVLAHSTHVKGIGSYEHGCERPRIEVILATGIPKSTCRAINLGYLDPGCIDPAIFIDREDEGVLYIPKAGETLYRCRNAPPELGGPTT